MLSQISIFSVTNALLFIKYQLLDAIFFLGIIFIFIFKVFVKPSKINSTYSFTSKNYSLFLFICTSKKTEKRLTVAKNGWITDFMNSPYYGKIFLIYPVISQLPPELKEFKVLDMSNSYHLIYVPTVPKPAITIEFFNLPHFVSFCFPTLWEGLLSISYVKNHTDILWTARTFDDTLIYVPNLNLLIKFLHSRPDPRFYPTILGNCFTYIEQYPFLQGGAGMVLSWYSCFCFSSVEGELSRLMYACDDSEYVNWGLKFGLIADEMASPFFIGTVAKIIQHYFDHHNRSYFSKCSSELFHISDVCLNPNRFNNVNQIVFYHGEGVTTGVLYQSFNEMMHYYNNSGLYYDGIKGTFCLLPHTYSYNYNPFFVKSKHKPWS